MLLYLLLQGASVGEEGSLEGLLAVGGPPTSTGTIPGARLRHRTPRTKFSASGSLSDSSSSVKRQVNTNS